MIVDYFEVTVPTGLGDVTGIELVQQPSLDVYKRQVKECLWKLAAANGDWEVCAEAVRKIVDDLKKA